MLTILTHLKLEHQTLKLKKPQDFQNKIVEVFHEPIFS